MSHHHERQICRCGAVIMQCRCMEPKVDKVVCTTCPQCAPLTLSVKEPSYAASTGHASPLGLTRREKIELLAHDNVILGACVGMHRFKDIPWTEALEHMVVGLAEANKKLTDMAIEGALNAPPPPIMVTCERGSNCILRDAKRAAEVATARAQFEASMNNPESARGVKVS